jgi:hypothetical protein
MTFIYNVVLLLYSCFTTALPLSINAKLLLYRYMLYSCFTHTNKYHVMMYRYALLLLIYALLLLYSCFTYNIYNIGICSLYFTYNIYNIGICSLYMYYIYVIYIIHTYRKRERERETLFLLNNISNYSGHTRPLIRFRTSVVDAATLDLYMPPYWWPTRVCAPK